MLPAISENDNSSARREVREPNSPKPTPKSPKKSITSVLQNNPPNSKIMQSRPDISSDASRSNQAHKRGSSSNNANTYFYANIRHALQPEPKPSKGQRASEGLKDSSLLSEKKSIDEEPVKSAKAAKPKGPTLGSLPAEDIRPESGTKTVSNHDLRQGYIQNPRSARDALKAKFKDREQHSGSYSPLSANHYKATSNLAPKPQLSTNEMSVNKLAAKYIGSSKSPNNLQFQQAVKSTKTKPVQDTRPQKPATGEKALMHSSSKQSQRELNLPTNSSNESRAQELQFPAEDGLMSAMKRSTNLTPVNKEKMSLQNSAVKIVMQKSEVLSSGKEDKKEKQRSPSPNIHLKKNQRDVLSISPVKKEISVSKEKSLKEASKPDTSNNELRKNTPVQVFLSEEEKAQYGNRAVPDYEKMELLGKGGFALVWLGVSKQTGKKVAIKQMAKKTTTGSDSKKADLYYGQLLFKEGGEPREEFCKYPGISHIASFIDYKSTKFDDWHISELCGKTLSGLLFDMKGEFCKGERVYAVKHLELHKQFKHDHRIFKTFIKYMAETLDLFSNYYIVHCDIKPENILINLNIKEQNKPFQLKMIDFGSSYNWGDTGKVRMATPEYMPPEFLNALNDAESSIEQLAEISKPWSVDVWSLGAILLEIITGIPLWIPLKCKLETGSKTTLKYGLFAAKGRAYDKIYQKQKALVENLPQALSEYLNSWPDADNLFDLLQNILKWDPKKRISPCDILRHPYVC